jgi:NAD(P)H-flavin reductase
LLLSAVEGLETKHLVVAACGPPALVETVRNAVVAAKMEHPSISFEFRGCNPNW